MNSLTYIKAVISINQSKGLTFLSLQKFKKALLSQIQMDMPFGGMSAEGGP